VRKSVEASQGRAAPRSTRAPYVAAIAVFLASIVAITGAQPSSAAVERTWYVATTGDDGARGSIDEPFATLAHAVRRAVSGDTIVMRGGVYRESVQVFGEALAIESAPGERAVLDGAVDVTGWSAAGDLWVADGWTTQFSREPSGGPVAGDRIIAGYPDQLFVDGEAFRQVLDRSEVAAGVFFHDTARDQLWIGSDPSGRRVEASTLRYGLYFNNAHGSSLSGVTLRRFATEWRDMAALRVYSDDVVVSDVTVRANARMGVSAIGSDIVVRNSDIVGNGYLGVHGDQLDGFVLENSTVRSNNREGFDEFHSAGGVKITDSTGVTIRDNEVSGNDGPGVWADLDVVAMTVVGNLVDGNSRAGIEIELSSRVNVLDNVALDNGEAGIWLIESRDVQVLHNASFGNVNGIEVEEGPRREVANIRVENNTIGDAAPGSRALLDINDWTATRSAADMDVQYGYNAYWIPPDSATTVLSRIGRWPDQPARSADIDEHRAVSDQAVSSSVSRSNTNPYVSASAARDYRWLESSGLGSPLTSGAARALGVEAGDRLSIGPVTPLVRRWDGAGGLLSAD